MFAEIVSSLTPVSICNIYKTEHARSAEETAGLWIVALHSSGKSRFFSFYLNSWANVRSWRTWRLAQKWRYNVNFTQTISLYSPGSIYQPVQFTIPYPTFFFIADGGEILGFHFLHCVKSSKQKCLRSVVIRGRAGHCNLECARVRLWEFYLCLYASHLSYWFALVLGPIYL